MLMNQPNPAPASVLEHVTPHPRPFRMRWVSLSILVLLGLGVYLFLPKYNGAISSTAPPGAATKKGRGQGAIPVVAAKAHKGSIPVYFTGLGAVTPINTVTLKSRVDGQLMKVLYKEGDTVQQGGMLVEIDPRPFQVQLSQAEGQLIKDQAQLENARID